MSQAMNELEQSANANLVISENVDIVQDETAGVNNNLVINNINNSSDVEMVAVEDEPVEVQHQEEPDVVLIDPVTGALPPPKTPKKRKSTTPTPKKKKLPILLDDDDDDGSTCSICLDNWELAGPHRLTSLKCGHLFGNSCIKRWIEDNSAQNRSCPQCKKRVYSRDFRFIYAKRVTAIDNSEEIRLREQLKTEREKYMKLEMEYSLLNINLKFEREKCFDLQERLGNLQQILASYNDITSSSSVRQVSSLESLPSAIKHLSYKLFLEKNIPMGRDAGCRVMLYNSHMNSMIVTHKSSQALFRGYGARLIDLGTYRPNTYFHLSEKVPRDLALCTSDNLLVAASLEKTASIYDLTSRTSIVTIKPPSNDLQAMLWSCCFNQARSKFLYLGTSHGKTYIYDIRQPNDICDELLTPNDYSPVINLVTVEPSLPHTEFGGILVCKLKSLWFYEYQNDNTLKRHQLNSSDTYISMSYDTKSKQILLATRPSSTHPNVRYIIGSLVRNQTLIRFDTKIVINGSHGMKSMLRSTIINMDSTVPDLNNCILAGYQEDLKQLNLWNVNSSDKLYSLPIQNTIYDLTSFQLSNGKFLGGLTENEFKIYKIHET